MGNHENISSVGFEGKILKIIFLYNSDVKYPQNP